MAQHVGLETTQNLSIIKQPKVIKDKDLPILTTEEGHRTMFINKSTAFQCVIITTQWRKARCTKEDCPVKKQHAHYIHDDEVAPQGQMVRIRLPFCQDTTCEDQPDIHVHQSDGLVITVEIPEAQANRLRQEWNSNSMSMMVEKLGTISTIVDERADEEHIAEQFVCGNTECPNYYVEHLHYFNVDPNFPHFPITPTVYQRMLDEGLICEWQECQWRDHLHVHFPEGEVNMMLGDPDTPLICEDVVDERYSKKHMAEYYLCYSPGCEVRGRHHQHLFNMDPDNPRGSIAPNVFEMMEDCDDENCQWGYPHRHLPKNMVVTETRGETVTLHSLKTCGSSCRINEHSTSCSMRN